jgi:hypothetical protein
VRVLHGVHDGGVDAQKLALGERRDRRAHRRAEVQRLTRGQVRRDPRGQQSGRHWNPPRAQHAGHRLAVDGNPRGSGPVRAKGGEEGVLEGRRGEPERRQHLGRAEIERHALTPPRPHTQPRQRRRAHVRLALPERPVPDRPAPRAPQAPRASARPALGSILPAGALRGGAAGRGRSGAARPRAADAERRLRLEVADHDVGD